MCGWGGLLFVCRIKEEKSVDVRDERARWLKKLRCE